MEQRYLLINGVILFLILLLFLRNRKKTPPTKLNLGSRDHQDLTEGKDSLIHKIGPHKSFTGNTNKTKQLNVLFQFNGHSWDAYEVLGIVPGTNKAQAEIAFDKLIKTADTSSLPLLKAAINAIRMS